MCFYSYTKIMHNNYTFCAVIGLVRRLLFSYIHKLTFNALQQFLSSPGDSVWISGLPLNILLPATPQYITYDGSLTQPGCQESVTWVIFNKPIYVLKEQVNIISLTFV